LKHPTPGPTTLHSEVAGGADVIERGLKTYRPGSGEPEAVLLRHRLLERQYYRLAHWRLAGSEINYRRFFDINALMQVEDAGTSRPSIASSAA
jgi:(1->4)-alpha-D-glucan 1-alpha-D-glucosylmutase